jgi:type III secretion protein S
MSHEEVMFMALNTVVIIFYLSMPIIGAVTVVGLTIALLQTLIQLQEQTLAFAAKLTTVIIMLAISGGWMANQLLTFINQILTRISGL